MATKVIMNLKYTAPTPPKNLQGNKRSEYIARRNFYNLTSDYNYFTYTLNDKKSRKEQGCGALFYQGRHEFWAIRFEGSVESPANRRA